MKKIREVIRLRLSHGSSVRQIAAACGIGRGTVSEYLARIESSGLTWPSAGDLTEAQLAARLFPAAGAQATPSIPMPDWSNVRRELSRKGVTLKLVWEEYRREHPGGYCYSRYARHYRKWRQESSLSMRQVHEAGEKLFVDWAGQTVGIVDAKTGEVWQAQVFVAAQGSSQHTFAKAYETQQQRCWLNAHVEAFEFYGGLNQIVVPDNPKTGVDRACRYEPVLNQSYAELARFYDIAVLPARARKPKDKAKVENAVQQVERWVLAPLRDRRFFSLSEANQAIALLVEELGDKVMKGPGLSRRQLFEAEDKPAMRPLPEGRWHYAEWKRAKVGPDYHVEAEGHFYSVPFTSVGSQLDVRISLGTVEMYADGERIASHRRSLSRRGFTTDPSHMPEGHRAHADWTPERIVRWAQTVGPSTAAFCQALMNSRAHPEQGFRPCIGTLRLEAKFGKERLEAACGKAASLGSLSCQSVKSILDKKLEAVQETPNLFALPSHENVRGKEYYTAQEAK